MKARNSKLLNNVHKITISTEPSMPQMIHFQQINPTNKTERQSCHKNESKQSI